MFDNFNLENIQGILVGLATQYGVKLLGALVLFFVGKWLIKFACKMVAKALAARKVDQTVAKYAQSALEVVLNVALVVALLGFFGVQTTTFAAVVAAAGVAIGMAWSGLLANFAAGVFLVILRPFEVGQFITAGGTTGDVVEIGLFVTKINTPDNVMTIVGNNKIFSGNIQNYSHNDYRRVELVAQLNHSVDHREAIKLLEANLKKIPNITTDPAPQVEILEFNLAGPVLAVRPFCHTDYYWDVYFATNEVIRDTFGEAGYPIPEKHYHLSMLNPQSLVSN